MFGPDDGHSPRQLRMIASPIQYTPVPQAAPQQQQLAATATTPQAQWSQEETRELIRIRTDLERDFTAAKRNKKLWESVSAQMGDRAYRRTPDQCKCKWKSLLNRYKGTETSGPENSKQCPFFEELHTVLSERAHNMQRLHLESEKASSHLRKKAKKVSTDVLFNEASDDEDEEETDEERPVRDISRKRKADVTGIEKPSKSIGRVQRGGGDGVRGDVFELLKEFFEQQQRMEMQWREMMERRAQERMLFEQEWRQMMEKLERERLMVEQSWREREEQRRLREESRAERRDALLTTLLNKILQEHNL